MMPDHPIHVVKHGRRHTSLKEKTYRERAAQDAPGYKRAYAPIDVAEPTDPTPAPPSTAPLASRLGRKAKRQLKHHAGVDADEPDG